jgi:hypothetical protein
MVVIKLASSPIASARPTRPLTIKTWATVGAAVLLQSHKAGAELSSAVRLEFEDTSV